MFKLNSRLMAGAALSALLLAGCGGGGGDEVSAGVAGGVGGGVGTPPTAMQQTVSNVFDFISQMIANNSENSDPIDVNAMTLAADDTSEPTPFN
ncbi:hypothetical protein [Polaromonas sp.]|uniref:hypothetical protein n=1 Tax=Polaromonas sp. TaxID=1869339 RepID=UPI00286B0E40|nr:hypothetical protein [Polaromonas sp.]